MEFRKMVRITLYAKQEKRHRCTEQTFGLCGRRRGWDVSREQHVYYLQWNRSPAQVGCMRQVLGPGALGRLRGIRWRGRWEGWLGWGIHVTPWLIHVNVWQNPRKCCEVISLQLIKINEKKKKKKKKKKVAVSEQWRQPAPESKLWWALVWDSQTPELWEANFCFVSCSGGFCYGSLSWLWHWPFPCEPQVGQER